MRYLLLLMLIIVFSCAPSKPEDLEEVVEAYICEDAGFIVNVSSSTIFGYSTTDAIIPAGEGILTQVSFSEFTGGDICFGAENSCNVESPNYITDASGGCIDADWNPCYSSVSRSYSNEIIVELKIQNVDSIAGTLEIYMVNNEPVGEFQFELSGINLTGASNGSVGYTYLNNCENTSFECLNSLSVLAAECSNSVYLYINGSYHHCTDLQILQNFININSNTFKHYLDSNDNGCIEFFEFGNQNWRNGRLISLDLSYNHVETTDLDNPSDDTIHKLLYIPENIGNLDSLEILKLNNNLIEDFPDSFSELTNLKQLELESNLLDRLPDDIGNLSNLEILVLNYNHIVFLPQSIGSLQLLTQLKVHNNSLVYIPPSIGDLSQLEWLFLNNNFLDSIPENMGNLEHLKKMNMDYNSLYSLPEDLCKVDDSGDPILDQYGNPIIINSELESISLINNKLCDFSLLPSCITENLYIENKVSLGNQNCTNCPPLHFAPHPPQCIYEPDYHILQSFLDLNEDSWIGGSTVSAYYNPAWWENIFDEQSGSIMTRLVEVTLIHKELYSEIPENIGDLNKLKILRLEGNYLTGEIPDSLTNLHNLEVLKLNSNELNGDIPDSIGRLMNLDTLWLNDNALQGGLPSSITRLSGLINLRLELNNLTGEIPSDIGDLSSIKYLRLDNNFLTGGIPESIVNLTNLERLYLKDNDLSGQIPAAICDIESLFIMMLHNNKLCPGDEREDFIDENGNGIWDDGEDFIDENGNGIWEDGYPVCFPDFQIEQQDTSDCPE